jgi:hypothetical protein
MATKRRVRKNLPAANTVPLGDVVYVEQTAHYYANNGSVLVDLGELTDLQTAFLAAEQLRAQSAEGVAGADAVPASLNALDDEFNGSVLDPKWTWVNQNNAAAAVANGRLKLTSSDGDRIWSMLLQTAPSAPWTIAAKFRMQGVLEDWCSAGIHLRNSSTGAHVNIGLFFKSTDPGGGGIEFQEYSDLTTYAADVGIIRSGMRHTDVYMKVVNDGTNLTSFFSTDGIVYTQVATDTIANAIGAVNQVGLATWSVNGGGSKFDLIVDWFRRLA